LFVLLGKSAGVTTAVPLSEISTALGRSIESRVELTKFFARQISFGIEARPVHGTGDKSSPLPFTTMISPREGAGITLKLFVYVFVPDIGAQTRSGPRRVTKFSGDVFEIVAA
jgi:hypothetical protein